MTTNAQNSKQFLGQQGSATVPSFSFLGAGTNGFYLSGTNKVSLATNGTQAITVDASQNVGIGIAAPAAALQVASGNIRLTNGSAFSTATSLIREINAASGSSNQYVTSSIGFNTGDFSDAGVITFGTANNASTPTERMRITQSGNVGIGTSSPEAKTSIVSSAGAIGLTIKDANAGASNYLSAQYNGTSGVADINSPTLFSPEMVQNGGTFNRVLANDVGEDQYALA
jgi:hypothetical protein